MRLNVPVILGTVRTNSYSARVAGWIRSLAEQQGLGSELIDLEQFNLPRLYDKLDPVADPWREIVEGADGYIFVVPEYNHSFPGVMKDALDYAYKQYNRKPALIVSVSDGQYGGVRMAEHFIPLLVNFGMVPIKHMVHISNVDKVYEAGGPDEGLTEKMQKSLTELAWYTQALKSAKTSE